MSQWDIFWATLEPLIILGITVGVVLAVMFGAVRIGWKFAPWIVLGAMLVWFFSL